jgi:hypothetical protein
MPPTPWLRVRLVAFLGAPMPRRIFVRINGHADGGVAVSIGDNATKEEFLMKATSKLLRGKPDHVDASGALIYFEGGQYVYEAPCLSLLLSCTSHVLQSVYTYGRPVCDAGDATFRTCFAHVSRMFRRCETW